MKVSWISAIWPIVAQASPENLISRKFQTGEILGLLEPINLDNFDPKILQKSLYTRPNDVSDVEVYRGIQYGHNVSGKNRFKKAEMVENSFDFKNSENPLPARRSVFE